MKAHLAVLVAFTLCSACGDSGSSSSNPFGQPGMPAGFPADASSIEDMMKGGGKIQLTDEMMQGYVDVLRELKDVKTPAAAMLARYKLDLVKWGQISMVVGTSMGRAMLSDARPRMQEQLAKAREQAANATNDSQRQIAEMQVQALEKQLEGLKDIGEANDIDRKNLEVINRWKDRLEAARR